MNGLTVFYKKEWLETVRTGRLFILILLFALFGIMNPAIAKLTPWMMEMLADTMAESGLLVVDIQVDAMTSWTQFFKNIPIALIAFVLIYSDIFTREYQSGTLLLILTKGLPRYKVVLAKTGLMLSLWTFGYWLCFFITYGYNAYYWDNGIVDNLFPAAIIWWLFGVWTVSLIVICSALLQNNAGVIMSTGGTVLLTYLISMIPKARAYMPMILTNTAPLLSGAEGMGVYTKAVIVTGVLSIVCIVGSIPIFDKKPI